MNGNGILIDDSQSETILDFLYLVANFYSYNQLNLTHGNLP